MFDGIELQQKWVINGSNDPIYTVIGQSLGDKLEIIFSCGGDSAVITRTVEWVKENMTQIG